MAYPWFPLCICPVQITLGSPISWRRCKWCCDKRWSRRQHSGAATPLQVRGVEFAVLWPTINSAQLVPLHFWHVAIAKSHELFGLIYEFPLVATLHIHTNTRPHCVQSVPRPNWSTYVRTVITVGNLSQTKTNFMKLENKTEMSTTQKPEQTARRPGHRWKGDIKALWHVYQLL